MDFGDLAINFGPNFAGLVLAVWIAYFAFKRMDKIANNALHGQAETNLKIADSLLELKATNVKLVDTMEVISKTLSDHSASDALIFGKIDSSLGKQTEILIRLEERTRSK